MARRTCPRCGAVFDPPDTLPAGAVCGACASEETPSGMTLTYEDIKADVRSPGSLEYLAKKNGEFVERVDNGDGTVSYIYYYSYGEFRKDDG